jgi:hypothetical protein
VFRRVYYGVKLLGRRTVPAWIIAVIFITIVSFPHSVGNDNRRIIVVIGNVAKRSIVKIVHFHKGIDVELLGKNVARCRRRAVDLDAQVVGRVGVEDVNAHFFARLVGDFSHDRQDDFRQDVLDNVKGTGLKN